MPCDPISRHISKLAAVPPGSVDATPPDAVGSADPHSTIDGHKDLDNRTRALDNGPSRSGVAPTASRRLCASATRAHQRNQRIMGEQGCKDSAVLSVRAAQSGDLDDVIDLWTREGGPTRHAGGMAEARALLARDPEALLVAVVDGTIVGAVIAGWDGWRFHIYRLAVDRSARRRGVASEMVTLAHQRAAALGAARVDAMVDPDNSGAIAFWQSIGYELDRDARWSRLGT
jgi:ribosomal protein S18 acetylase RimI-like enzyme